MSRLTSCLRVESYPWAITSWVDMAESQHLSVAPSLPNLSPQSSLEHLDKLCQQIDAIYLEGSNLAQCTTPIAVKTKGGVTNAPVKRRKGLLGLMAEADNADTVRKTSTTEGCGIDEQGKREKPFSSSAQKIKCEKVSV